jgi:Holliday junction resolvase RusA-like endonuclease
VQAEHNSQPTEDVEVAELRVVGIPAPKGSKTRMPNGAMLDGKSPEARAALAEWVRAVADEARAFVQARSMPPMDGPLAVTIEFRFPLPASDPHRTRHTTKPDIDKLERATLDALKAGGLIKDDARVFQVVKTKTYARGEPVGADILVVNHATAEHADREASKGAARARTRFGAA